jgi:monofunctional glycosyltransferase
MSWLGLIISKIARVLLHHEWEALRPQLAVLYHAHLQDADGTPPWIAQALLISGEDHRFFDHSGVDVIALCRAVWRGCVLGRREGASTIEMQLIRVLTGRFERTCGRKIQEIALATMLGSAIPKHDIPALYLRIAYYGTAMESFPAACARLCLVPASMSPGQAAALVARLKYPEPSYLSDTRRRQLARRTVHLLTLYNRHVIGREYRGLMSTAEYASI